MKHSIWCYFALSLCAMVLIGCMTVQKVIPTAAWHQARIRNEGYSLLYRLMDQESDVSKVLIIKHADAAVALVIKEIAEASGQAKKQLDEFAKEDRHLSFKMANLPQIEEQTRAAIAATEAKQLLFASGQKFQARLLVTEAEGMNYAAHLAKVLQDQESDSHRKEFLGKLAAQCTAFHDRVINLL